MTDSPTPGFRRSPLEKKRWGVPPGLLKLPRSFLGAEVLDEAPGELGLLLFQVARDVELWGFAGGVSSDLFAENAAERRRESLAAGELPRPLRTPLAALSRLLSPDSGVSQREVSLACQAVATWAAEAGYRHTATTFEECAVRAGPEEAGAAYRLAVEYRRVPEHQRAETWFRRTLGLARRGGDWKHYGLALVGLGNLHMLRGNLPKARAYLIQALRASRRYGLGSVRPMALHDLFVLAVATGQFDEAEKLARQAYRAYGKFHPRVSVLAHDVGCFWMKRGQYARALPVFKAEAKTLKRPSERLLALANMARAAAGCGDGFLFATTWDEVWKLIDAAGGSDDRVAEALVGVAAGAVLLGDRERATLAATHALAVALRRREAHARHEAEMILAEISGSDAPALIDRPGRSARLAEEVDPFALDLVEVLETAAAAS